MPLSSLGCHMAGAGAEIVSTELKEKSSAAQSKFEKLHSLSFRAWESAPLQNKKEACP